jgi:hypothetical protein
MVAVCPKHVKDGLNTIDTPHVAKLNNNQEKPNRCKCAFCHLSADYRLFNERPYRKKKEFDNL